jgi:DNA repair protein RecO (recombination protein O)
VYHNDLKNLQFIKEYHWGYLYEEVLFNVVKNAVAMYVIELMQHSLKQPEANAELFYLIEDTLKQLDKGTDTFTANLPLYFTLHLGSELGFRIQGEYLKRTPVLDLKEGEYVNEVPSHPYYIVDEMAKVTSQINQINFYSDLETIQLNKLLRRELLKAYQQYVALHIFQVNEMKSLTVLQQVLS